MKVLVTGATGFIGRHLVARLLVEGYQVVALVRRSSDVLPVDVEQIVIGDIAFLAAPGKNANIDARQILFKLEDRLNDVDVVVHAAAHVHILRGRGASDLDQLRQINVLASIKLSQIAAKAGVKRFVYISTIGVNGSSTHDEPFKESDTPSPHSYYALSKWEAEQGLRQVASESEMEIVIIRPPMVYGLDAPGNFRLLLKWVERGLPLPLARITNRRAFISVSNLVDFITLALTHPRAANESFLVSDGNDISTTSLLKAVATTLKMPSRLFYLPRGLMVFLSRMLGRKTVFEQLWGSLEIDTTKARTLLSWQAKGSLSDELGKRNKD